jgi:hypothetical protein
MPSRVHSILGGYRGISQRTLSVCDVRTTYVNPSQAVASLVTSRLSLTYSHFANLNPQATGG